jgi:hypothetical protein
MVMVAVTAPYHDRMRALALIFLLASTALAADNVIYEQVLIPFDTLTVPGVGTVWSAELHVRNDGNTPVNLFPETCLSFGTPFPCDLRIDVPAQTTVLLDVFDDRFTRTPFGLFVYVPTTRLDDVSFSLLVRASSGSIGTAIPVVRRSAYRSGRTTLLNVPLGSGTRASLRIYCSDVNFGHAFNVRVYREPGNDLMLQQSVFFGGPTDAPVPPIVPLMFDVSSLLSDASLQKPGRVRVTIEPTFPLSSSGYWPLLTVTDNATQQVTAFTPQ